MKKILILFLFTLHVTFGNSQSKLNKTFSVNGDTIFSALRKCNFIEKPIFHKVLTLNIDNSYYTVIDSVISDLNSDGKKDYIYVLSTYYQENLIQINECIKKNDSRLIIFFLSSSTSYNVIYNDNLILNNFEYQSEPFNGISILKNNVVIKFYVGTRFRYWYRFTFKANKKNEIYLIKKEFDKYDIHLSNKNKYFIKKFRQGKSTLASKIDIRNFMKDY
jgi:hypothetical protein